MLGHYRVLDLCTGTAQFAGHLLASLGAEVIAVEPPGGARTRHEGPFVDDVTDHDRSLTHWAYNRGKRSVVLDLHTEEGRADLQALVATADALLDDAHPGDRSDLGLGIDALAACNPALVHATITPYGTTGPRAHWLGTDLTATAGSSFLFCTGDADRAPVRVSLPQAFLQAGADAAAAVLIALRERATSGLGQHIDVSAQESMTHGHPSNLAFRVNAAQTGRMAGGIHLGGLDLPFLFPCRDGYTICVVLMGAAFAPFSRRVVEWELEEGFGDDELAGIDWVDFGYQLLSGERTPDVLDRANAVHAAFLATKTKAELWQAAFERKVLITPSQTIADLVDYEHFIARGFWEDHPVPGSNRTARAPGPLVRFGDGQPPPLGSPPLLGSTSIASLTERRPEVPTDPAPVADGGLPLEGVNVLEFSWIIATPSGVRILADYGATVVKVENSERPDTMRTVNPFVDEEVHLDNSVGYGVYNAGKRSLGIDLTKPGASEVIDDLVAWADIVTESFAPGAIDRLGFGYGRLSAINPRLIMLSSSLLGQTGPHAGLAGYGFMAAALAGFYDITGWPDRGPAGPYGPYTDYLAPRFVVASLVAALEHRDRTGRGQNIDLSQAECAIHYLAPAILDQTVNDRTLTRSGNDDSHLFPHGVYRSKGDDAWVAVACSDGAWPALAALVDRADLALLDQATRRARRSEIDGSIEAWTSRRSPSAAAEALQERRIAAYPVNDSRGAASDPQFVHRGHHVEVPQNYRGSMWTHGCRTKMSRTPARIWRGGPCLGEDTFEILTELLGYEPDRVAELAAAEVFE